MSANQRNRLYLFWTVAILLCFFMAMFAAFFSSCAKQDLSRDRQPPTEIEEPADLPLPEEAS